MTTIEETTPHAGTRLDARQASLRPFARPGRGYWLLAAGLALVVAAGVAAWIQQLRHGLGAAGYNDLAFWTIYEANLVTFIGVSYGGAVISAILRLTGADWRAPLTRLAEGTAVVTVLIGGSFVFPHLGRPERVWELVTRPNLSSPIFWDLVAVATYAVASIVFFALPLVPDMAILRAGHSSRLGRRNRLYAVLSRGWVGAPRQRRVLGGALGLISIMIIPLAVSVHSVLSWAFALVSRPWWHESIWAPYFVVAALYSGVALVILVVAGFRRAYHLEAFITPRHFKRLGFILATFAAAYVYLTFADILPGAYVGDTDTATVFTQLLTGRFAPYFWIFVVGAGLLPLLLIALPKTRKTAGIVTAAAFVVPAMWLKRMLMVTGPGTYNRITGTFGTYHFTWVSVSVTLAGLAAVPLLLMLLFRIVPLLSIDEIEHAEANAERSADGHLHAEPANGDGHQPVWPASGDGHRQPQPVGSDGHPQGNQPAEASEVAGDGRAALPAGGRADGYSGGSAVAPAGGRADAPVARFRFRRSRRLFRVSRATGVVLLLLTGLGVLAAHTAAPASAATAKQRPAAIKITATETGSELHLAATLTGPGGTPLAKARMQFLQVTTEFGSGHLLPLGSATTNALGTAQLSYQPTVTGTQQFTAKYAGGDTAGPATATTSITVTTAHSPYQPAPRKPLAVVGQATVAALLTIVVLVWLTLALQIVRVRRACRARAAH